MTILRLAEGTVDNAAVRRLAQRIERLPGSEVLIVDLTTVTLTPWRAAVALLAFLERVAQQRDVRLVCPRLSARRLLRLVQERLQVFLSVEAALTGSV